MQEPEIFEQPVGSKDPEQVPYNTGFHRLNVAADDSSTDGYHDFVYPEGEFSSKSHTFLVSHFAFLKY
jgi:hypothetical protein